VHTHSSRLAALCAAEFELKGAARRRAFNPNPHLTAIDVEHLIVFLCGRSVSELERLVARVRVETNKQVNRDREVGRMLALT
jgi:hypothetical protein